jgi:hypothetical protein
MTSSFDVFDRDDFRSPDDLDRGASGGSESFWSVRVRLSELHRKEERADAHDREAMDRSGREHPPLRREGRVREILAQRVRTVFRNRDKTYELRDSEIHLLSEVGKFRVVAQNDLAEFAYNGDRNRAERDIENLQRQGLAEVKTIPDVEYNTMKVVTLTKEGNKLLRRGGILEPGQRTYHGLKKPNEAAHDADLYRLYHKVSDEIESQGGRVVGVRLDYELKDELYSRIARASKSRQQTQRAVREEMAKGFHLKVVDGKIPIPDLRIEYVNENDCQLQRRDLELATDHYRPRGLSEKARAGFQVYARAEDTNRLRSVRDREELMATILRM